MPLMLQPRDPQYVHGFPRHTRRGAVLAHPHPVGHAVVHRDDLRDRLRPRVGFGRVRRGRRLVPGRNDLAFTDTAGFGERPRQGLVGRAVDPVRVEVCTGGRAGRADGADRRVPVDLLADRDRDRRQMCVVHARVVRRLEVDEVPVAGVAAPQLPDAAHPPRATAMTPEKPARTVVPADRPRSTALRVYWLP